MRLLNKPFQVNFENAFASQTSPSYFRRRPTIQNCGFAFVVKNSSNTAGEVKKTQVQLLQALTMEEASDGNFSDIVEGNEGYVASFNGQNTPGLPARNLLLLTCMDCRILPHEALGVSIGDMKVMRNGGAQLNANMVSDLILANNVLDCDRILIMPHTRCGMAAATLESVRATVASNTGAEVSDYHPAVVENQMEKLVTDVKSLRNNPLVKPNTIIEGAIYDVETGKVNFLNID